MSRDVSLTILSKNTSTSNTDEILVAIDSAVLSRGGISNVLATLWKYDFYDRNPRLARHPAIAARRKVLRTEFGSASNEPSALRIRQADSVGIEFICETVWPFKQTSSIRYRVSLWRLTVASVKIAKWHNSRRFNALWLSLRHITPDNHA